MTNASHINSTLKTLLENPNFIISAHNASYDDPKDNEWNDYLDATATFLGPTLWTKSVPNENDIKLETMDMDELLSNDGLTMQSKSIVTSQNNNKDKDMVMKRINTNVTCRHEFLMKPEERVMHSRSINESTNEGLVISKIDSSFLSEDLAMALSPSDTCFDPANHRLSPEELKPHPIYKKSKKQFVPSDLKDEKYWSRRRKNNLAAKRSREARRIKENQIALRALFLEKENNMLKKQLMMLRKENELLVAKMESGTNNSQKC